MNINCLVDLTPYTHMCYACFSVDDIHTCIHNILYCTLVALLNPELAAQTWAIKAILRGLLKCSHPRISESVVLTLSHLLNTPCTRRFIRSQLDVEVECKCVHMCVRRGERKKEREREKESEREREREREREMFTYLYMGVYSCTHPYLVDLVVISVVLKTPSLGLCTHLSTASVVVSCKIPILATRVRFPGSAHFLPIFFSLYRSVFFPTHTQIRTAESSCSYH